MPRIAIKYTLAALLVTALVLGATLFAISKHFEYKVYRYKLPLGNPSMSLESYLDLVQKRVATDPSNFMDLNTLADIRLALGKRSGDLTQVDEAVKAAQKSLAILTSPNPGAKIVLAHALESQHQFEKAIESAKNILFQSPNSLAPYSILVTSYLAEGNLLEAQAYADLFVQRSPKIGAMSLRGLVLINAGREDEGVFDLEKSFLVEDLGEEGDSTWARAILARYYLSRGQLGKAEVLIDEALRISPNYPLAVDLKAQLLARHGQTQAAEELFDQAFSQSRQIIYLRHSAELDQMTNRLQLANDRWVQAEKFIRVDLDKGLYGHRLELAKILLRRKNGDDLMQAAAMVEVELKLRQSAEAYYLMALIQFELNQPKNAAGFILQSLRKGVHEARIYELAARIYQKLGLGARSLLYRGLTQKMDTGFNPQTAFL